MLVEHLQNQPGTRLSALLHKAQDRQQPLDVVCLLLRRNSKQQVMPNGEIAIAVGDELLLCGSHSARRQFGISLANPYTLAYLASGEEPARGWVMQWLQRKRRQVL